MYIIITYYLKLQNYQKNCSITHSGKGGSWCSGRPPPSTKRSLFPLTVRALTSSISSVYEIAFIQLIQEAQLSQRGRTMPRVVEYFR